MSEQEIVLFDFYPVPAEQLERARSEGKRIFFTLNYIRNMCEAIGYTGPIPEPDVLIVPASLEYITPKMTEAWDAYE